MLQMLSLLGICFGVQWPKAYEQVVREVRETINLNFVNLVTVSCYMQWNYFHTLLLRTLFPAFIILVLILASKIRRRVVGRDDTAVVMCLEIRDMIIFLAYPSTTATIFTTFVPRKFSCGEGCAAGFAGAGFTCGDDCTASFLAADLSVEFYQGWHRYAFGYAVAMIPVWPLGVPAYMLIMFLRNRRWIVALRDEQRGHHDHDHGGRHGRDLLRGAVPAAGLQPPQEHRPLRARRWDWSGGWNRSC